MDKNIMPLDTPKPLIKNLDEDKVTNSPQSEGTNQSDDTLANSSKAIDPISVVEVEYSQDQLAAGANMRGHHVPHHNASRQNLQSITNNLPLLTPKKREIKILPKPAIGLSIGNITSNGTGRPSASTTYFIVATVPTPIEPDLHIDVPIGKRKTRYKCPECPIIFTLKGTLKTHLRKVHKKKKRFHCEVCNRDFCGKNMLINHMESIHKIQGQHKCTKCNIEFHLRKALVAHVESEHRKNKYYSCKECEQEFQMRSTMRTHMKNIHQKGKTHICQECNAVFSWKKALNIHIDSVHKNLPQFRCDQCTSVFRWKSSLAHHIKQAHKPIEMYKYPCFDCTSTFATANRLNCHRKKVHKDQSVPSLPRRRKNKTIMKPPPVSQAPSIGRGKHMLKDGLGGGMNPIMHHPQHQHAVSQHQQHHHIPAPSPPTLAGHGRKMMSNMQNIPSLPVGQIPSPLPQVAPPPPAHTHPHSHGKKMPVTSMPSVSGHGKKMMAMPSHGKNILNSMNPMDRIDSPHHLTGRKMHENIPVQMPVPMAYTPYPHYNPYYHQ